MKWFLSLVLLLIFIIQLCVPVLWYAAYQIKINDWTELHCENITKPEIDCKAKCFLNKKIEETQTNTSQDETIHFRADIFWFYQLNEMSTNLLVSSEHKFLSETKSYSRQNVDDVFHPPKNLFRIM